MIPVVWVEGLPGAGKSTLCRWLEGEIGAEVFLEQAHDTAELTEYYANPKDAAFHFQVHMLTERAWTHEAACVAAHRNSSSCAVLVDRSVLGDLVFSLVQYRLGNMTPGQFRTYQSLYQWVRGRVNSPTAVLYLKTSVDVAMDRVKRRGVECERRISVDYMKALYDAHTDVLDAVNAGRGTLRRLPVYTVDWNDPWSGPPTAVVKLLAGLREDVDLGAV